MISVQRVANGDGHTFTPYTPPGASKPELVEGAKYDSGKCRIELFPGEALFAISQVLTYGATKYADRNWEKGISYGRVYGALMRHMWAWWQGRSPTTTSFLFGDVDEETKFSHLWHAGCCLVFLITYEAREMKAFDDRSKGDGT